MIQEELEDERVRDQALTGEQNQHHGEVNQLVLGELIVAQEGAEITKNEEDPEMVMTTQATMIDM